MKLSATFERIATIEGYKRPKIYQGKLRLDTNENKAIPTLLLRKVMSKAVKVDVREYPTDYNTLIKALAKYLGIKHNCIAVGNGSDQIIDLLLSIARNVKTVTIKPTFSFYIARCKLYSLEIKEVSLDKNLSFDSKEIINSDAELCYLSSPNNPTGNQFDKEFIIDIIESFNGLIIIDEAYAEFAKYSLKDLVNKYDNLIILRTMSKAFGLAGLRLGYAIANPSLISIFNNIIQYPYPVNTIAVNAAKIMLDMSNEIVKIIEEVKKERDRIYDAINNLGLNVFKSDANFIMFEANDKIFKGLLREGIVIKDLGIINSKPCYRVTIANKTINDKFIRALRKVCS